jgi:hypothetical protein
LCGLALGRWGAGAAFTVFGCGFDISWYLVFGILVLCERAGGYDRIYGMLYAV